VDLHRLLMFGMVPEASNAMHLRMQRLDPSSHHAGKPVQLRKSAIFNPRGAIAVAVPPVSEIDA